MTRSAGQRGRAFGLGVVGWGDIKEVWDILAAVDDCFVLALTIPECEGSLYL